MRVCMCMCVCVCVLWEVREDFLEEGTPQVGFGKIEWEWK